MSNPAATATNRSTQKHKVPKYFKGEKVAKHPDLVTVSINFVFILFDNFAADGDDCLFEDGEDEREA